MFLDEKPWGITGIYFTMPSYHLTDYSTHETLVIKMKPGPIYSDSFAVFDKLDQEISNIITIHILHDLQTQIHRAIITFADQRVQSYIVVAIEDD